MSAGHGHSCSLAPGLLLAMPQLNDPNFRRSVVLLCKHTAEGAFGLIVNRPLTPPTRVRLPAEGEVGPVEDDLQLWIGGPVEPERSWILLRDPPSDIEVMTVADGVHLSTSSELLHRLLAVGVPAHTRLIVGYAGWGPGQLDAELQSSSWLTSDIDLGILFDTPAAEMWEAAIRRLGADPSALQASFGVH